MRDEDAPTTPAEARKRLRILAIRASEVDDGRTANLLSAYAVVVRERPERWEEMRATVEALANQTPNRSLAAVLREASRVVHSLLDP